MWITDQNKHENDIYSDRNKTYHIPKEKEKKTNENLKFSTESKVDDLNLLHFSQIHKKNYKTFHQGFERK